MEEKRKTTKEKSYVCVVCGKQEKASGKVQCCGKDMLAEEKGTWNA